MSEASRVYEIRRAKDGRWFWRLVAEATQQIIARSARTYKRSENAIRAARREVTLYPAGTAVVLLIRA